MTTKLQGATLRAVVAEVLTEQEAAERAQQKAEVKRVVERVQRDLAGEKRCQQEHLTAAAEATERMKKLQERLKAIKAGDQAALKTPESVGSAMPTEMRRCLQVHKNLLRDMEIEQNLFGAGRGKYATFRNW